MSKYTTQLRFPVEQFLKDMGLENAEENWPAIYEKMGLSDYPIFSEEHRRILNDKFIRRYFFREIGFETFGQFRFYLRSTLHEIMPYYNSLYTAQAQLTDPLKSKKEDYSESFNTDFKNESEGTSLRDGTTDNVGTTIDHSRDVYQDTPMSLLNNAGTPSVENLNYATNVTYDDSNGETHDTGRTHDAGSTTNSSDGNTKGWRVHTLEGFTESQSKLLAEYRKSLMNIDKMVLDELQDLFLGLW